MPRLRAALPATDDGDGESRHVPTSLPNTPSLGNPDLSLGLRPSFSGEWNVDRRARTSSPLVDASGIFQDDHLQNLEQAKLRGSFHEDASHPKGGRGVLPLVDPAATAAAIQVSEAELATAQLAGPVHPDVVPLFTPVGAIGAHGTPHSHLGRLPDGRLVQLYPPVERASQACELCRRRKAKCSGGMQCDRCKKANKECVYAQVSPTKRYKEDRTTDTFTRNSGQGLLAARARGRRRGYGSSRGLRGSKLRPDGSTASASVEYNTDGSSTIPSMSSHSHRSAMPAHLHATSNPSMSSLIDAELAEDANKSAWNRGAGAMLHHAANSQGSPQTASMSPNASASSVSLPLSASPQTGSPWMGYPQHSYGGHNYQMPYPSHNLHGQNALGVQMYAAHPEEAANSAISSSSSSVAPPPSYDEYHRKMHAGSGAVAMEMGQHHNPWLHTQHAHYTAPQPYEYAAHHQAAMGSAPFVDHQSSTDSSRWKRDFISAQDFS
ncbi:transcription factor grt1 [Ceraceosorus bombacis]|uniref:Transcription factor grt1 n=1 Tax=Ceraceosorus bombacis TaxID=401625 RepID=A0A0P1BL81_9BASI|nr:transcription factor grt1 [Ceraceosorus bombacis]